jgi:hypothetical protein
MGGESVMRRVRASSPFRVFLLPVSLPVRSRFYSRFYSRFQIQLNLTQSLCLEQKTLDRQRDSSLYHTISSSIELSLGGSSNLKVAGVAPL